MSAILTIMLTLMTSSALLADTKDIIEPFGKISWEDGFVEIVKHINSMSPETTLLKTSRKSVDIKGDASKDVLSKKLRDVAKMHVPQYFDANISIKRKMESKVRKYKSLSGDEKTYMDGSYLRYSIEASPIIILGVPFKMEIFFTISPGLAVHKPEHVLEEDMMGYTFPLILKGLQLSSRSPALEDKYQDINNALRDKYKKYDKSNRAKRGGPYLITVFKDDLGNQISIKGTTKIYKILYSSQVYDKKLEKKYREHLHNLKLKKGVNKNMDSGL